MGGIPNKLILVAVPQMQSSSAVLMTRCVSVLIVSSNPCKLHPVAPALREESGKAVWFSRFEPNFLCGFSAVFEIQIFQSVWGHKGLGTIWAQSSFTLHPKGTGSKLAIVSLYLSWHRYFNACYFQCKLETFHWGGLTALAILFCLPTDSN